jgi:hypothetical protein
MAGKIMKIYQCLRTDILTTAQYSHNKLSKEKRDCLILYLPP